MNSSAPTHLYVVLCTEKKLNKQNISCKIKMSNQNQSIEPELYSIQDNPNYYILKLTYHTESMAHNEQSIIITVNNIDYNSNSTQKVFNDVNFCFNTQWESLNNNQNIFKQLTPYQTFEQFYKYFKIEDKAKINILFTKITKIINDFDLFINVFQKAAEYTIEKNEQYNELTILLQLYVTKSFPIVLNYTNISNNIISLIIQLCTGNLIDNQDHIFQLTLSFLISQKMSISQFIEKINNFSKLQQSIIKYISISENCKGIIKDDIIYLIDKAQTLKEENDDINLKFKCIDLLKRSSQRVIDIIDITLEKWEIFFQENQEENEEEDIYEENIDIEEYIEPHENDNFNEVYNKIKILRERNLEGLVFNYLIWNKYIEAFKDNYKKSWELYLFSCNCQPHLEHLDQQTVKYNLYHSIMKAIEQGKLIDIELFNFLIEAKSFFRDYARTPLELDNLSKGIRLNNVNDNYIEVFHRVNFKEFIGRNEIYILFINKIFASIRTLQEYNNAMRLFKYYTIQIPPNELNCIINNLSQINKLDNRESRNEIEYVAHIIITIIMNTIEGQKKEMSNKLFNFVNKNVLLYVLAQTFFIVTKKDVLNILFDMIENDVEGIIHLMKIIKSHSNIPEMKFQEIYLFVLDRIQNKIISKDDLLDEKKSINNFSLFACFKKELKLFNNNIYTQSNYYKQSNKVILEISKLLETLDESDNRIKNNKNLFIEKLSYLDLKPKQSNINNLLSIPFPKNTKLWELVCAYIKKSYMNFPHTNTNQLENEIKNTIKEMLSLQTNEKINNIFRYIFIENKITDIEDEFEMFDKFFKYKKEVLNSNLNELKYNIYCISNFQFLIKVFNGLSILISSSTDNFGIPELKSAIDNHYKLLSQINQANPFKNLKTIKDALHFLELKQFPLYNKQTNREDNLNKPVFIILSCIENDLKNNLPLLNRATFDISYSSFLHALTQYKTFIDLLLSKFPKNNIFFLEYVKNILRDHNIDHENIITSLELLKKGAYFLNLQRAQEDETTLDNLLKDGSVLRIKKNHSNLISNVDFFIEKDNVRNNSVSLEEILALRARFLLMLKNDIIYEVEESENKPKAVPAKAYQGANSANTISLIQINLEYVKKIKIGDSDMFIKRKLFCEFIFQIKSIIDILNELIKKGFLDELHYSVNLSDVVKGDIKIKDNYKQKEIPLNILLEQLKKQLDDINKHQIDFYSQKDLLLTYIYGENLGKFIQFLKEKKSNSNIISLLLYITDHKITIDNIIDKCEFPPNAKVFQNDKTIFESISKYLNSLLKYNNITGNTLHGNAIDNSNQFSPLYNKKGIFMFWLNDNESYLQEIIWLYQESTNKLPHSKNVLFCSLNTTEEEIISFLCRAFFCGEHNLFSILFPEKLSKNVSDLLLDKLNTILSDKNEPTSCIVFFISDKNSTINKELLKHQAKLIERPEEFNVNIKQQLQNVVIIKSDAPGIGKSTFIKNKAKQLNKRYIYYPLGGAFSEKEAFERLFQLDLSFNSENILFHLDLGDTKKKDELNTFLFSFLILKVYSYSNLYFMFPLNLQIYIELPLGFYELDSKFTFLSLFNTVALSHNKLPPLIIDNDITSNQQIVLNYLHHFNNLNKKNVFAGDKFRVDTENIYNIECSVISDPQNINKLIFQNDLIKLNLKTYFQIQSFIDICGIQLKYLSRNNYLEVRTLLDGLMNINFFARKSISIRQDLVKSLIENAIYFTKGAYNDLLIQNKQRKYDKTSERFSKSELSRDTEQICFEIIKTPLVFINDDEGSISIISNTFTNQEMSLKYLDLFNSGDPTKSIPLVQYKSLKHMDLLYEINKVLNLRYLNKDELNLLNETIGDFKFTADNFIKMILILLKVRAKIPVIMMGETGCGKTFLIKTLAELIQSDKKNLKAKGNKKKLSQMKIFTVHPGTTDEDLLNFMEKEKLLENNFNSNNISNNTIENMKNSIWVFLDEINTCNSMELIKEMLTNHTILGRKILKEVIFIAACNPYRTYNENTFSKRKIYDVGLKLHDKESTKYVYYVKPLPYSLLHYVFNFGTLKENDEKKYIKRMISDPIIKSLKTLNNPKIEKQTIKQIKNGIFQAHKFIREQNDPSYVSLREVRRFNIFYSQFFEYLSKQNPKKSHDLIAINSAMLSIHLCYYCRIPDNKEQQNFVNIINQHFNKDFNKYICLEEDKFAQKIPIPSNIAKTKTLKRIIFVMFFCIISKVPIIICGKPGSSKSLSFDILFNAMQGPASDNEFLKQYPTINKTIFQGSLASTSKGLTEAFENAHKQTKGGNIKSFISLLYFDEMGLAEMSPNNPLKVLHSQLECDETRKIAFVGISNWAFSASLMNRCIYLTVGEPDENDLKQIAKTISDHTSKLLYNFYNNEYDKLAKAYFKLKKDDINDRDFSLRDFYFLINQLSTLLSKNNSKMAKKDVNEQISFCIEKNFGPDKDNGINLMKQYYFEQELRGQAYDKSMLIKKNLIDNDIQSRFLMLISNNTTSHYLIQNFLNQLNLPYYLFIGSQFKLDINDENYSMSVLNKIRIQLEKKHVLLLKNLRILYPSLFNLFNLSYTNIGNQKFINIAVGYSGNFLGYVNNELKCILLVEKEEFDNTESPLKSRFEKHFLSYESLLDENLQKEARVIYQTLNEGLFVFNSEAKEKFDEKQLEIITNIIKGQMINCTFEEIYGIIYNIYKEKLLLSNSFFLIDDIDKVLIKIVPTFSQDIILFLSQLSNSNKVQTILSIYKRDLKYRKNLETYFDYLKKKISPNERGSIISKRCVIYTFSTIHDDININDNSFEIESIKLGYKIKCDNDIQKLCDSFYNEKVLGKNNDNKIKVLIVRFSSDEFKHFSHVSSSIDNFEKDVINKLNNNKENNTTYKVIICYIIHIQRSKKIASLSFIPHISTEYYQVFIDDLIYKGNITFESLFRTSEKNSKPIIGIKDESLKELNLNNSITIKEILNSIDLKLKCENNDSNAMIQKIIEEEDSFKSKIIEHIKGNTENVFSNYFANIDLYNSNTSLKKNVSLINILSEIQKTNIISNYKKVIYLSIKDGFLIPFVNHKITSSTKLLSHYCEKSIQLGQFISPYNRIEIFADLKIPCFQVEINKLINCSHKSIIKYKALKDKNNNFSILKDIHSHISKFPMLTMFLELSNSDKDIYEILKKDYYTLFKWKHLNESFPIELVIKFLSEYVNTFINEKTYNASNMDTFAYIVLLIESNIIVLKHLLLIQNNISFDRNEIQVKYNNFKVINHDEYIKFILENELKIVFNNIDNKHYENKIILENIISYANLICSLIKIKGYQNKFLMFIKQYYQFKNTPFTDNLKEYLALMKREQNMNNNEYWNIILNEINVLKKLNCNSEYIVSFLCEKLIIYPSIAKNVTEYITNSNNINLLQYSFKLFCEIFKCCNLNITQFLYKAEQVNQHDIFFIYQLNHIHNKVKDILNIIDNTIYQNTIFTHCLFYYFTSQLTLYFTNHKDNLCSQNLFNLLKKIMIYSLNFIYNPNSFECSYKNLHKIFYLAYIKVFLTSYAYYISIGDNNSGIMNIEQVQQFLKECLSDDATNDFNIKTDFKNTLKIYLLKLFSKKYPVGNSNYQNSLMTSLLDLIQLRTNTSVNGDLFEYKLFFIQTNDFDLFCDVHVLWEQIQTKQFVNYNNLTDFINTNIQDKHNNLLKTIIDIAINNVSSKLFNKEQYNNIFTNNFSVFMSNIINKFNLNENSKKLISVFFNKDQFDNLYNNEISTLNKSKYEIYLYAFQFALLCASNANSFYGSLFSNEILNIINDNYIPGAEPNEEEIIHSYYYYKNLSETTKLQESNGYYICGGTNGKPCGYLYHISPCGLPFQKSQCPVCGSIIAGVHHKLEKPSDYRIYYDKTVYLRAVRRFPEIKNMNFKYFNDFEQLVLERINLPLKGIKKVKEIFFSSNLKIIRKIKQQIIYRLLNFVLYSCIHFSKHLGYITEQQINNFIPYKIVNSNIQPLSTLDVLFYDWKVIEESISNQLPVQIFMNTLLNIKEFTNVITICPKTLSADQRDEFEITISQNINHIPLFTSVDLENLHFSFNKQFANVYKNCHETFLLKVNTNSNNIIDGLINQNIISLPNQYESIFPMINYFYLQTFPSKEVLKQQFINDNELQYNYPLLYSYINNEDDFSVIQNIIGLNPLVNQIHDSFDFHFSRQEIISTKLSTVLQRSKEIKDNFDLYKKSFNLLSSKELQYGCKKLYEKYKINSMDTPIAYFVVDNGSLLSGGIYLAAMYEYLANKQNCILNSIVQVNKKGNTSSYLNEYINQEVMIQDAIKEEVLSPTFDNTNSKFNSFEEMILYFSIPCFYDASQKIINYSNYHIITFDMNSIESQLVNVLLSGKKKFSINLRFMNFKYEGYANEKSKMIDNYNHIYLQEDISTKTKQEIKKYIYKSNQNPKVLYDCLQYLMYYIYKNSLSANEKLLDVINKLEYSDKNILENFIRALKDSLEITKLVNILEVVEELMFNNIKDQIHPFYLQKVSSETETVLKNWIIKTKDEQTITPEKLRSALKKFILRFLYTKREENILPPEHELFSMFLNVDSVWDYFVKMSPIFEAEKKELQDTFKNVQLNCAFNFYEILNAELTYNFKEKLNTL